MSGTVFEEPDPTRTPCPYNVHIPLVVDLVVVVVALVVAVVVVVVVVVVVRQCVAIDHLDVQIAHPRRVEWCACDEHWYVVDVGVLWFICGKMAEVECV